MASIALTLPKGSDSKLFGVERDEWIRLANWLLVWVVTANIGFALMWLIGAPPRMPQILAVGAIGLIVRNQPRWLQFVAYCAALIYSILSFIAGLFNLLTTSLLYSLRFFLELNPTQSIEYMIGGSAVALLAGVAWLFLKRPQHFTDVRMVLAAIVVVLLFAQADWWMGRDMRGHYKREAVEGTPFTSAINQSGFALGAGADGRNLMVIMVESLGEPVGNPEMDRLLFARYRQPSVAQHFHLSQGTTTYYNSTTSGEVRELCGRWGDYYDLLEQRDNGCLPAQLRRKGFDTIAYHSFAGEFFRRNEWYPNIGFGREVFAGDLLGSGLSNCGGVFPGVCDREMPRVLAARLKAAKKPQFVYWLTVNTHLPVPLGVNLNAENCERLSPVLAKEFPMICRQFAIWDDIDAALVEQITAPDFPPTDILIVGDHMPPYFDRHHRSEFAPDRVPWLYLRWKAGEEAVDGKADESGFALP